MLMCLGQFVWGINTLAYQELQRSNSYNWASNNRVGQRPARQYVGPGDETISLTGWISPELCGDATSLDRLRLMAEQGTPYVLVDATGTVFGLYVIEQIDETGSIFGIDSKPRKIDFTVNLTRVDDNRIDQVGLITDTAQVLA